MADGSVTTTSNVAPRYVATVNVSQTAYTQICTISGNSLASAVNMSFQGTSGAVVVNVTAQILVNHYQDISITTTSGFYSQLNLRVISNNNESYSVEAQVISGVGATTDLNIEVFPLNGESVTFGGSPTTPGTTLVHTTRQGLYVSASEPISISSSGDIYAATNVGIGTTSPASMLHISGTGNTFTRYTNTTNAGHFMDVGSNSSGQHFIFGYGAYPMLFGTNGSEVLRITSGGNVGIGTTSPAHKLSVVGQGTGIAHIGDAGFGSGNYVGASFNGTLSTTNYNFLSSSTDTHLYINRPAGNAIKFREANVEQMTILAGGNVGIGTTSPYEKLEVAGAISATGAVAGQSAQGHSTTLAVSGGTSYLYAVDWGAEFKPLSVQGKTISLETGTGSTTARVTIDNSGNVGIGTTSPAEKLQVAGNVAVHPGQKFGWIYNPGTDNNIYNYIQTPISGGVAASALEISGSRWTNGNVAGVIFTHQTGGQIMTIMTGGNVGIGTTSPAYKLDVVGKIFSNTEIQASSAVINSSGGYASFGSNSGATPIRIGRDTTSNDIIINASGDVGIGTTSPAAKLHVIGNVTVSATLLTANAKLTGTLTDSFNQVGTAGQVLSSTGTGTEWITGGGGGGGSTIIVKDEGTTIGSSFTTLNFIGDNVNATASGSTAVIQVSGRASSGSIYYEDVATPFVISGGGFADVEINTQTVFATVPSLLTGSNKLMATITFGVSNVSTFQVFNGFQFRLYNVAPMSEVQGTTHSWNGYMSKDEGCTTTVFTFHIPIDYNAVNGGDTIVVQADALTNYTPEIYYCALTLMEGTN